MPGRGVWPGSQIKPGYCCGCQGGWTWDGTQGLRPRDIPCLSCAAGPSLTHAGKGQVTAGKGECEGQKLDPEPDSGRFRVRFFVSKATKHGLQEEEVSSAGREGTGRSGQQGKEGAIRPCKGLIPAAQSVPPTLPAARTGRGEPESRGGQT